jgi:hypothetical protein
VGKALADFGGAFPVVVHNAGHGYPGAMPHIRTVQFADSGDLPGGNLAYWTCTWKSTIFSEPAVPAGLSVTPPGRNPNETSR